MIDLPPPPAYHPLLTFPVVRTLPQSGGFTRAQPMTEFT